MLCLILISDTVKLVKEYILANPDVKRDKSKFILGGGWDHTAWPSNGLPSAVSSCYHPCLSLPDSLSQQADLDADPVIEGRPVVLQSKDCHALWVSSAALENSLPLPSEVEGGVIVRDRYGRPTGKMVLIRSIPYLT